MSPTKTRATITNDETAETIFHLVHPTSGEKPLCGAFAPTRLIGSYVEHLDTASAETPRWVREIFGSDGKVVSPCALCLSLYPPQFIDIVPFDLVINIHFKPDEAFRGYDVTSSAFATLRDTHKEIEAYPMIGFISLRCLGSLEFIVNVNANAILPQVESANKGR